MPYMGVILHHSVCPSINGKGYDFYIDRSSNIIPAYEPTDTEYIHICVEGDFSNPLEAVSHEAKEQLFVLKKLILRLTLRFHFSYSNVFHHTEGCPGRYFPWPELVISLEDRYH
jgi:hypothetical protein